MYYENINLAQLKNQKIKLKTKLIFSDLKVDPVPGDAVLWVNMQADERKEQDSLHGACPTWEGQRIAASMWIRARGQEFIFRCPPDSVHFGVSSFL